MTAQITALPTPPSTNDPANFNTRADAFLGQMPTFVTEANALAGEVNANTQAAAASATAAANKVVEATGKASEAAASAASALNAPGTNGTSTTSLTIGTGTKAFTTQTGKAWVAGQGFFLASTASPLNWMSGVLTAYNASTGAATLEVDTIGGSGTFAAWTCGLAAGRPMAVATQAQAEAGSDPNVAMTPLRTGQAISALADPVGTLVDALAAPSARWLPCSGGNYLNASYPLLAGSMAAYINPMVLRQTTSGTGKLGYGGGVFVAWLYNGTAWAPWTSGDGVAWTVRTNPFGTSTPQVFTYGNGVFVAATNSAVYSSPDGVTWTQRGTPTSFSSCTGLAYGAGIWVLSGSDASSAGMIATSSNLAAWTARTPPSSLTTSGLAYDVNMGRWLIVGSGNGWWTSTDGVTWSIATTPGNGYYICSMNGKFFISGNNGSGIAYWTTTDGTTYVDVSNGAKAVIGATFNIWQLFYDGARLLAAGSGTNTLAWSADGASWTALTPNVPGATITGIARANSSINTPIVIAAQAMGLRSGQDVSTTQFVTPVVAGRASGFSCFIKAA